MGEEIGEDQRRANAMACGDDIRGLRLLAEQGVFPEARVVYWWIAVGSQQLADWASEYPHIYDFTDEGIAKVTAQWSVPMFTGQGTYFF